MPLYVEQEAELVAETPNAEELIERAGRCCYQSSDKIGTSPCFCGGINKGCRSCKGTGSKPSHVDFIRNLISNGHLSCLEHAVATFRLITDKAISTELTRHRIASYSCESSRYCSYSKGKFGNQIKVVVPKGLNEEQEIILKNLLNEAEKAYIVLSEKGCSAQVARDILPQALRVEMYVTANFREWLHILDMRTNKKAHPKIVELMKMVGKILAEKHPIIFEKYLNIQ